MRNIIYMQTYEIHTCVYIFISMYIHLSVVRG